MDRLKVEDFVSRCPGRLLIDVRSPAEYDHAHIPGAFSLPLFSNEERKTVGTAYKQESRETAIKLGLDFFGPKMRPMVEWVEQKLQSIAGKDSSSPTGNREVFVYCWRGGMRSAAVAWLLDLYGFRVHTLIGGYKAFRNLVLHEFEKDYSLKLLGGYTGSGKTGILRQLETNGETIVDLEDIAIHKGSAFGNIEMPPQPTQEMFENLLAMDLRKKTANGVKSSASIWVEDESQRIGNLNIPMSFWNNMRRSPIYFIEIDFEKRLNNICAEYGNLNREKLADATRRIHKRLGPNETKKTLESLEAGNIRDAFRILLQYYDKQYLKGLHNRNDLEKLLTILPCPDVSPGNARLLKTIYLPI